MKRSFANAIQDDDLRPEYDFRGAVRGRHHKPLHEGYSVHIQHPDGTTEVQYGALVEGMVILQPDVRQYFPDSDAVSAALRSLIALMETLPYQPRTQKSRQEPAVSP